MFWLTLRHPGKCISQNSTATEEFKRSFTRCDSYVGCHKGNFRGLEAACTCSKLFSVFLSFLFFWSFGLSKAYACEWVCAHDSYTCEQASRHEYVCMWASVYVNECVHVSVCAWMYMHVNESVYMWMRVCEWMCVTDLCARECVRMWVCAPTQEMKGGDAESRISGII